VAKHEEPEHRQEQNEREDIEKQTLPEAAVLDFLEGDLIAFFVLFLDGVAPFIFKNAAGKRELVLILHFIAKFNVKKVVILAFQSDSYFFDVARIKLAFKIELAEFSSVLVSLWNSVNAMMKISSRTIQKEAVLKKPFITYLDTSP